MVQVTFTLCRDDYNRLKSPTDFSSEKAYLFLAQIWYGLCEEDTTQHKSVKLTLPVFDPCQNYQITR